MSKDEINRLLAEKVMGWTEENGRLRVANACVYAAPSGDYSDDVFDYGGDTFVWNPHDRITQAMMVVEKVIAMGYALESHATPSGCSARFFEGDAVCFPIAHADTLSAAICMAALKVVEND